MELNVDAFPDIKETHILFVSKFWVAGQITTANQVKLVLTANVDLHVGAAHMQFVKF